MTSAQRLELARLREIPQAVIEELEQDAVRHRDIAIEGCSCKGCDTVRETATRLDEYEHEERQRYLYRKALKGIRRHSDYSM